MTNTPLFQVWSGMKHRCYAPSRKSTGRYEERGITVCDEWRDDFMNFYNWAITNGYEEGLEIDREDNDGNYEPSNCRFVTRIVNSNNRENSVIVNYKGREIALGLLLQEKGIPEKNGAIRIRIKRYGWDVERAVDTPIRKKLTRK